MPMPVRDFSVANPSVTAVNDAKRFLPFDPARLDWLGSNSNEDATPAMNATGLGLHLSATPGASPVVLAASMGLMACVPTLSDGGQIAVQRLHIQVSPEDLARLQGSREDALDYFDVDDARFVYEVRGPAVDRLRTTLSGHHIGARLPSVGNPRASVRWTTAPTRATGVDFFDDEYDPAAFEAWFSGGNALPRYFADGVQQQSAVLLHLQPGGDDETLTLFAEVRRRLTDDPEGGWYRVNPGFVLERLRGASESRETYVALSGGCIARGIASGGRATARMDLCAVSGGTLAWPWDPDSPDTTSTVVLQPRGVVPPALFSFVTCDEIRVFAARLAMNPTFRLTCAEPTIAPAALREAWPAAGTPRQTFRAVEYASAGIGAPPRDQRFYDALARVVTYAPEGRRLFINAIQGDTLPPHYDQTWRAVIPQEDVTNRPLHPVWQKKKGGQLRRLYPLRYYVCVDIDHPTCRIDDPASRVGDPAARLFAVQQDTIDCARQEYVCHLNWKNVGGAGYYYQDAWANRIEAAEAHSRLDENGNPRTAPGTSNVVPAIGSSSGRIVIPARTAIRALRPAELERDDRPTNVRSDLRPLLNFESAESLSPYRPLTNMHFDLLPRLTQVRDQTYARAMTIESILAQPAAGRAAAIDAALAGNGLTPFLAMVVRELLVTIPAGGGMSMDTVPGFLHRLFTPNSWSTTHPVFTPLLIDAEARFNDRLDGAKGGTASPRGPADVAKRLVLASSTWRGPEHNETTSVTIASNHQVGLALDLKPSLSGPGARNPLLLAAIHDVGQEADRVDGVLEEMLLELESTEYVLSVFDVRKAGYRIIVLGDPPDANGRWFAQRNPTDPTIPDEDLVTPIDAQKLTKRGVTSLHVARKFDELYNMRPEPNALNWPNPAPTYLQMYVFALLLASHVHFTFTEGVALP